MVTLPSQMAEDNFVLFKRNSQDSDDHDEIWDDTALIEAYDKAVYLAKEKIAAKLGLKQDNPADESSISDANCVKSMTVKQLKKQQWNVGDNVQAPYSQDGLLYEGVIQNINKADGTCLVKFLGYENEEEIALEDVLPSAGPRARSRQIADANSSDQMEFENEKQQTSTSSHPKQEPSLKWESVNSNRHNFGTTPFPIPPPPPPTLWPIERKPGEDTESLYSMLMAWYMAGYHTGYYQGVREGKTDHGRLHPS